MKKNMGSIDKIIRVLLALIVGILYFMDFINGITAIILGVISIVFIATSMISFCPLYIPFKINTCKKKK